MFDKLKKLFIVEDPNAKKAEASKDNPTSVDKQSTSTSKKESKVATIITGDVKGKVNPKFIEKLLKAIEKNNIDGFDYLEYKQTLQNLDKNMLEQTRYKSAFAMAKTMGVDQKQLKESAQYYLDILKQEEKKFNEALRNQVDLQITQRKNDFKGLEQAIVDKEKQIQIIQKEIEAHKAKLKQSNVELENAKNKINRTKAEFDKSYESVYNQIKNDLEKMNTYLK